jgi:hypothetical protein
LGFMSTNYSLCTNKVAFSTTTSIGQNAVWGTSLFPPSLNLSLAPYHQCHRTKIPWQRIKAITLTYLSPKEDHYAHVSSQ